jgi:hypothetical protein
MLKQQDAKRVVENRVGLPGIYQLQPLHSSTYHESKFDGPADE